jgi:hypothetical protein
VIVDLTTDWVMDLLPIFLLRSNAHRIDIGEKGVHQWSEELTVEEQRM